MYIKLLSKFLQLVLIIIFFLENKIACSRTQLHTRHHRHRHLALNLNFFLSTQHTHTHTSYKYNESMMMRRKSFFVLCFQLFSSREGTVKRLKWKTVWRWENLVQNKIYKVQSDWKLRCSENFLLFLLKIFCRQFFFFLN